MTHIFNRRVRTENAPGLHTHTRTRTHLQIRKNNWLSDKLCNRTHNPIAVAIKINLNHTNILAAIQVVIAAIEYAVNN